MKTKPEPIYFSTLLARLVQQVNTRVTNEAKLRGMEPPRTKGKLDPRFTLAELSRRTALPYMCIWHWFGLRDRRLPLKAVDSILYALGMSLTDLLSTEELAVLVPSLPHHRRMRIYRAQKKTLAIGSESEDNGSSTTTTVPESQEPTDIE